MFGSSLNLQSITLLKSYLIAAYGQKLYIFNTKNQQCITHIDPGHQSKISSFIIQESQANYMLYSIDIDGIFIKSQIPYQFTKYLQQNINNLSKKYLSKISIWNSNKNKKQKNKLTSACFINNQLLLLIDQKNKLYKYDISSGVISSICYQDSFLKVKYNRQQKYAYAISQDQHKLKVYCVQSQSVINQYLHSCKILSVTAANFTLVIGDEKGKITLIYDYFNQKSKSKKNKFNSVLQWHTGPVYCLYSNGQYIYSAGEQSVVVLWHIRDLSRDFLPRVRTAIRYLSVQTQTNQIICGLSDNSIKIIDLTHDKQTYTYKTIIDPEGYAPTQQSRFCLRTTSYKDGLLCLNSLPGKLQFINLNKNGQNNQLQIVPRNLINSINQDKIQPHRIVNFTFSKDWTMMITSLKTSLNTSYLKFYRKGVQGYQLINKIQNPHIGLCKQSLFIGNKNLLSFITYSTEDQNIRIWSQHKQKKKSIVDSSQIYWKCSQEINYRNLYPTFINTFKNILIVVFNHSEIVFYQFQQNGSVSVVHQISFEKNVKEFYLLQLQMMKNKKSLKFLILRNCLALQYIIGSQTKNQPIKYSTTQKLQIKQQQHDPTQLFLSQGPKQIALIIKNNNNKTSQIILFNKTTHKFSQSYQCDFIIQSTFWMQSRLILIGADLNICSLDGKQFVNYAKKDKEEEGLGSLEMADQQKQTQVNRYDGEKDLFKLNQRWVQKQSVKNKKNAEDIAEEINLYPSCTSAWQQLSTRLFI